MHALAGMAESNRTRAEAEQVEGSIRVNARITADGLIQITKPVATG
jgi:hypothetical protein